LFGFALIDYLMIDSFFLNSYGCLTIRICNEWLCFWVVLIKKCMVDCSFMFIFIVYCLWFFIFNIIFYENNVFIEVIRHLFNMDWTCWISFTINLYRILKMLSVIPTNAEKHIMLYVACACSQHYTNNSDFWLTQMTYIIKLCKLPSFVEPTFISTASPLGLLIGKLTND